MAIELGRVSLPVTAAVAGLRGRRQSQDAGPASSEATRRTTSPTSVDWRTNLSLLIAAFCVVGVLSACGGGSGGGPTVAIPEPGEPTIPVVEPTAIMTSFGVTQMDHYPLDARFAAQTDLEDPNCCWEMTEAPSEIASRNDVLAMLRENAFEIPIDVNEDGSIHYSTDYVIAHASPPVVRFVEGTTRDARNATIRAIDNINAWLSWDMHITVGDDLDRDTSDAIRELEAGTNRPREEDFGGDVEAFHRALYAWGQQIDEVLYRLAPNTISAYFGADSDEAAGWAGFGSITITADAANSVGVIQHELLHSMGLGGGRACYETFGSECNSNSSSGLQYYYSHAPVSEFPESEMAYASPYDDRHGLSAIDGEVIQIIYTSPLHNVGIEGQRENIEGLEEAIERHERELEHLEAVGDVAAAEEWRSSLLALERALESARAQSVITHEMLSPENLGPWDDTVVRYHGSFDPSIALHPDDPLKAAFGVDWRNGMARPWTVGEPPYVALADSGLSGTVTWNGEFVGFTPAQEAVNGGSALRVDLASLDGSAAFTELRHWGAGEAPGEPDTGTQWGDGDLYYTIAIAGNYLRSNGGDIGYVSGRFVGAAHQGAVGILERPDLTGAFGAMRQ